MGKFNFNRANDDTLNVRISKETADRIRTIAKSVQWASTLPTYISKVKELEKKRNGER